MRMEQTDDDVPWITREEWKADPPLWINPLRHPVSHVFYEYTNKDNCYNRTACQLEVKFLQRFNLRLENNPDIRYNFLIGGDGSIFEGRGWHAIPRLPKRYSSMNRESIYIAFIGRFNGDKLDANIYEGRRKLLQYAVEHGYLTPKLLEYSVST